MAINESWLENANRYIRSEMSSRESADFETLMQSEPELEKLVLLLQKLQATASDKRARALQNTLHSLRQRKPSMESPSPVKLKLMRYWVAAAAVLLCILAIWFLIPKQADSNQLFAQYFQPEKLSLQTMDAEGDTLLLLAERNFNSNRFEAASRHLNAYLQNNPNDMEAILALGLAYLNMENYEAALTNFERCIQNEALNQYSALWYQSLVFLKIGKLEECRQGLEKLVATPGADFNAEAKALLQKLP